MSRTSNTPSPGTAERTYVEALSRPNVVSAYADWAELSFAEHLCLKHFLPDAARVLDLGCATGRVPYAMGDSLSDYLGVDVSPEMIAEAQKRLPEFEFEVADIVAFQPPAGAFDAVLLMHNVIDCLHPIERRTTLLTQIFNYIARNGVLICSSHLVKPGQSSGVHADDYHGMEVQNKRSTLSEWTHEIEQAGFDVTAAIQDRRGSPVDWAYIVATPRASALYTL